MITVKGYLVGFILLVLADIAFTGEIDPANDVKVDFVENVNANAKLSQARIVSGWDAEPGQHPHHVALRHVSRTGAVSGCGGVLIHSIWVLTAAHCVARGSVTNVVRAGVTRLETPEYITETTVAHIYPMYDWTRPLEPQHDDIAIIRLVEPVPYTKNAKPIRIQSRADAFRDYSGEVAYTSGFGRIWTQGPSPQVLQWVFLNVISNVECRVLYGTLINANSICAGPFNVTSQSICQGDSGGALVHIGDDGVPTLIGIASFVIGGESGCHSGYAGGFIRIGPFHNWLREVTGLDFEKLNWEEEEETTTTDMPTTILEPETEELSEENEEESSEEDSSEEDSELKDLLKRLEVKVKVKVKIDKYKKKHEVHEKRHERKRTKKKLP